MAVNTSRGLNQSLENGMSDGTYKKLVRDRESQEPTTNAARVNLSSTYYGIEESYSKHPADGVD